MQILAPAKINLNLRVLGRRADGFHEIESVMVPVGLSDRLLVEKAAPGIHFECDEPGLPSGPENLAFAAAGAFFERTGISPGVQIHLEKRIPSGAGLGGGSSDAAAVLIAMDQLFDTAMGVGELERLAAGLGSDVPWFVRAGVAVCRGRGEVIEPLPSLPPASVVLIKPAFPVATPWAYRSWGEGAPWPSPPPTASFGGHAVVNDLERPVFRKFPLLDVIKEWLLSRQGVLAAAMSGSGSTVFGVFPPDATLPDPEEIRRLFGSSTWTWQGPLGVQALEETGPTG